jgi:hypothetical protein
MLCLVSISLHSQNLIKKEIKELTIYSTSNKNINLFFPDPIKSGIVGSSNFKFGYSKEVPSKIGMLHSSPGEESNLLVITENGNIYSFIVKHQSNIERLNYFIKDSMAIGNENGEKIIVASEHINKGEEKPVVKPAENNIIPSVTVNDFQSLTKTDTLNSFKKNCEKAISLPVFYNRIYGTKDKIFIRLKNILYINDNLYFSLILENNSSLDFDINFLNFYTVSKNKKRNAVSQKIPFKAKYIHGLPSRIGSFTKTEVVYVYNKFSINENKTLLIDLSEIDGERNVYLEIPNILVNNPNY